MKNSPANSSSSSVVQDKRRSRSGSKQAWIKAFAVQALSDLTERDRLAIVGAPRVYQLHMLQMAAEKLCKASRILRDGLTDDRFREVGFKETHCLIAKALPRLLLEGLNPKVAARHVHYCRQISREIELLSPSCHENQVRPENVEYPWEDKAGFVYVPANYPFPNVRDDDWKFTLFLKLMRQKAQALSEYPGA